MSAWQDTWAQRALDAADERNRALGWLAASMLVNLILLLALIAKW